MIPLIGYSDRLSGRPGDTINFKVSSSSDEPFQVRLIRSICADPNPEGPGIIEQEVPGQLGGRYPSRVQPFYPGSYASIAVGKALTDLRSFTLAATVWPTLPGQGEQAIISCAEGITLMLGPDGDASVSVGSTTLASAEPLKSRHWYKVWASFDADSSTLTIAQQALDGNSAVVSKSVQIKDCPSFSDTVFIAVKHAKPLNNYFNGKIEAPAIYDAAITPSTNPSNLIAQWDFSRRISTLEIEDTGPHGLHGKLINLPARAMTGSNWTGEEMAWKHAPEQYGAIHFHDDDIVDFDWDTDFSFTIPDDLPSGIYAARLSCGEYEDSIPFFVCPAKGKRTADLCVLVSTFTYSVYGNHARPDFDPAWKQRFQAWNAYPWNPAEHREYGLSTYNYHSDGSGICHASHCRPLFNLRPGYATFGYGPGSGLRHFQADSHLIAWLEHKGYAYDIITDQELHDEGAAALAGYKALTTGAHPEYHTAQSLDALQHYRDSGGRLLYLGGNGFYWRVALHPQQAGAIEIRRAESGIRAWAAEPGEYYQAFDGAYGGLWRRNGRPPQKLAGIGFSAQGQFEGSYYRRNKNVSNDVAWIFDGIEDDILGDFGLSGGGAAGFELDRADVRLGTPEDFHLLASSEKHGPSFVLVPEEHLTHITNWPGQPTQDLLRADMIYFELPSGGAVFATGSITFCGSLPHNNFDNNISTLVGNVLNRFLNT